MKIRIKSLSHHLHRTCFPDEAPKRDGGFTLVVTLAMLVLAAGLITAYFSRALQATRGQSSSLNSRETDWLMESATQLIIGDFLMEMEAGSDVVATSNGRVFRPRLIPPENGDSMAWSPGMAAQRPDELVLLPNLVKVSREGTPFFESRPGFGSVDGPIRASDVNTMEPALNQRYIRSETWNQPRLMTDTEFALEPDDGGFSPPDWIYIDREGKTPDAVQTEIGVLANAGLDNPDFVLGRFAYVVYDVGGLLDINTLSNFLPDPENRHRGRLHQVSVTEGLGFAEPGALAEFDEFISHWRWPQWSDTWESATSAVAREALLQEMFDGRHSFTEMKEGHQGFVSRSDLLAHVAGGRTGIPPEALPYLTVYSRSLNTPHWRPDPDYWERDFWSDVGPDVVPEEFNPDLALVQFEEPALLERGSDPELEIAAGTPVMPRRFPLTKLNLFNVEEANWNPQHAADLLYYFGLERVDAPDAEPDVFRYTRAVFTDAGPRLARLHEVAEQGREPNFFEVLRAVVLAGSLGKTAGQTMTWDVPRDHSGDLHILQIGANVIDQWDADDIPTTLQFPEGGDDPWAEPLEVYGMENLPYINQFAMVPHRPAYERDLFQVWAVFDVWNPHQNASSPPNVNGFRTVPLQGAYHQILLYYTVRNADSEIPETLGTWHAINRFMLSGGGEPMLALNEGLSTEFPVLADYSEVVTVSGGTQPPEEESDAPGVLVWQHDVGEQSDGTIQPQANPGVGRLSWRPEALQVNLNTLYDHEAVNDNPDESPGRDGLSPYVTSEEFVEAEGGIREYPAGTEFTDLDEDFWVVNPPLPAAESPGGPRVATQTTRVYARYALKDWNALRAIRPSISAGGQGAIPGQYDPNWGPDDIPPSFALQVNAGRGWKTYQRVDGWFRRSAGLELRRGAQNYSGSGTASYARGRITHHLDLTEGQVENMMNIHGDSFYHWTPIHTFMRMDPRGHRFGFTEARSGEFGASIRSAAHTGASAWERFRKGIIVSGYPDWSEMGFQVGMHTHTHPVSNYHGAGFMTNSPDADAPNERHPARYRDRDGEIRPGDAYFGDGTEVVPSALGRHADRPVILNRPFRSEADLGFVFRDLPWKSLDFASRWSADLGLLDVFSLDEPRGKIPLVAGQLNLNTRRAEVLEAVLRGSAERLAGISDQVTPRQMQDTLATQIAEAVVATSQTSPLAYPGELVPRLFHPANDGDLLTGLVHKGDREAAIRTLAAVGQTRTWNFMIDLVVQSGRFTAASQSPADFMVAGERRYWLHLAMDRVTGEVVDIRTERVYP